MFIRALVGLCERLDFRPQITSGRLPEVHLGLRAAAGVASCAALGAKRQSIATPSVIEAAAPTVSGIGQIRPWIEEAKRNFGLPAVKGEQHNPTIIKWIGHLSAPFRNDQDAWCGTFAGWCIAAALPDEPVPANHWGSINWLKFGKPLKDPMFGCAAVFWRSSPSG